MVQPEIHMECFILPWSEASWLVAALFLPAAVVPWCDNAPVWLAYFSVVSLWQETQKAPSMFQKYDLSTRGTISAADLHRRQKAQMSKTLKWRTVNRQEQRKILLQRELTSVTKDSVNKNKVKPECVDAYFEKISLFKSV